MPNQKPVEVTRVREGPEISQMADRSSLLMTYTTFHIGVYLTLGGGAIALITTENLNVLFFPFLCFFVAGVAGGVIGSNLPDFTDFETFATTKIGFWGFKCLRYRSWARIEHAAFWIGLVSGILLLLNALGYTLPFGIDITAGALCDLNDPHGLKLQTLASPS